MGMNTKIRSTRGGFIIDVSATIAEEGPSHAVAHHGAAEILAVGAA